MFNRSEIMKAAWQACRLANTFNGNLYFRRDRFAACLKKAWQDARLAAGIMSPVEVRKVVRAAAIRQEIEMLTYKPSRINIGAIELRLRAELATLAA